MNKKNEHDIYSVLPINRPDYDMDDDYNNDYPEMSNLIKEELDCYEIKNTSIMDLYLTNDLDGLKDYLKMLEQSYCSGYAKVLGQKILMLSIIENNESFSEYFLNEKHYPINILSSRIFEQSIIYKNFNLTKDIYEKRKKYDINVYVSNVFDKLLNTNEYKEIYSYLMEDENYLLNLPVEQFNKAFLNLLISTQENKKDILLQLLSKPICNEKLKAEIIEKAIISALEQEDYECAKILLERNPKIDSNHIMNYFVQAGKLNLVDKFLENSECQKILALSNNKINLETLLIKSIEKAQMEIITYILEKERKKEVSEILNNSDVFMTAILTRDNILIQKKLKNPDFINYIVNDVKVKMPRAPEFSGNSSYQKTWQIAFYERDLKEKEVSTKKIKI